MVVPESSHDRSCSKESSQNVPSTITISEPEVGAFANLYGWRYELSNTQRENKRNHIWIYRFSICYKNGRNKSKRIMQEVSEVWLQFAIGHLTQSRVWEKSILGRVLTAGLKMFFFENRFSNIDLSQTAPPRMTVMTIGWYHVFSASIDLSRFLQFKSRFSRQTLIYFSE